MSTYSQPIYRIVRGIVKAMLRTCHPYWRIIGKENIPADPYIIVANHSSATDPLYVVCSQNPKRMYSVLAKREVLQWPVIGYLLSRIGVIPVDRDGSDTGVVMAMMKKLKNGGSLLLFPEGTRMKNGERQPAKGGAVLLASRCNVPIVPVYISTRKKFLRPVTIIFGKPYAPQPSAKKVSEEEMAALNLDMMDRCYALGESYGR